MLLSLLLCVATVGRKEKGLTMGCYSNKNISRIKGQATNHVVVLRREFVEYSHIYRCVLNSVLYLSVFLNHDAQYTNHKLWYRWLIRVTNR